jgi:predicted homoserine dehydrogenase-like protein
LPRRADEGRPVRIGLVGCGEMGTDIVTQVARMQGLVISAIADTRAERAHEAIRIAGRAAESAGTADSAADLARLAEAGRTAIVPDGSMVATSDHVDVVIDATGKPAVGAELGVQAMEHGKHLVMMNVEADVTIGAWLKRAADRLGVVYSLGAGDEPSSCMELIEFVSAMGHDIVAAGKGKNNPLNHDATPDQYEEEARRRNMNPRMLVEFVDGSKTMVEMAAIANATGLVPDKAGHARAGLLARGTVVRALPGRRWRAAVAQGRGRLLRRQGRGARRLRHRRDGSSAPARAHERSQARRRALLHLLSPLSSDQPRSAAHLRARRHPRQGRHGAARPARGRGLRAGQARSAPGDRLDAIGEYCYRSWIMTADEARAARAVPCGLLEGGTVTAPVAKGELLTYDNAGRIAGLAPGRTSRPPIDQASDSEMLKSC